MSAAVVETAAPTTIEGGGLVGPLPASGAERRRQGPTMAAVGAVCMVVAGLFINMQPLGDNSFLTHLATGRLLLQHLRVPHVDPYSFTAAGAHWVDQSWLAELLYGVLDKLGGGTAIVLVHGVVCAGLVLLLWRLTRPAQTVSTRLLACAALAAAGLRWWAPRPLVFGLLFLGLTILIAEDGRPATSKWLLPMGWVWVNTHGSFPLGIVYLVARLIGRRLDGRPTRDLQRATVYLAAGCALGAVGPVGPEILFFPLHLLGRHQLLSNVIEWRTADFGAPLNLLFLVLAVGALAAGRRGRLEYVIPAALFTVSGVMALRNIDSAVFVVAPLLAEVLRPTGARAARLAAGSSPTRPAPMGRLAIAVLAVVALLAVDRGATMKAYDLSSYPVHELQWMQGQGLLAERVAVPDTVGNYREWAEGAHHQAFSDDRFDMYPAAFLQDQVILGAGGVGWQKALDRYRIDAVLWQTDKPLGQLLEVSPDWHVVHQTKHWVVAVRQARATS